MSDPSPPPGPPPPPEQPGWAAPGSGAQGPRPGWGHPAPGYGAPYGTPPHGGAPWAPAHKPGIVPLRPLTLGDIYDGSFKAIRQNPRVMVGMSVVVVTGFLLLPALASLVLALMGELTGPFDVTTEGGATEASMSGLSIALSYAGQLVSALAGLMLTGMIVHVVAQAVLGRRPSAGETWRAVRGRLLALVGLTILATLLAALPLLVAAALVVAVAMTAETLVAVVTGVIVVPLALAAAAFLYVRLALLASPALVLERAGILQSMQRARVLTKGQFWRIFGIYLLTSVVVGIAAGLLSMPFSLIAMFGGFLVPESAGGLVYVFSTYLGLVLTHAVTTPFTSSVVALMYVDQRIRKEAFDVELLTRATQEPLPPTHTAY